MCKVAAPFDRKTKFGRSNVAPILQRSRGRQAIKTVVDFYGVKLLDVKTEHVGFPNAGRIKRTAPMLIMPSRGADMDPAAHRER